ncbi:MAG: RdgB/HAM1 family non-canonical purine NTP pyrophosphatase [Methanomicrobiales archaeon]|nr:RdgB/HAM1 family non-canonical purine NTP pyrophosphatase [Methanomicrobiales archaeon]
MKLAIVTGNPGKVREIELFFRNKLEVEHVPLTCPEFRDPDVSKIAMEKARYAFQQLNRPLIVDDTAFYIEALNGFPGPCAAYVLDTIGIEGILTLMKGGENRRASFETAVAFADESGIKVFTGRVNGTIVHPRGHGGFGYDPIFEWDHRTFAEIPLEEKNRISHRGLALRALAEWLVQEGRLRIHKD